MWNKIKRLTEVKVYYIYTVILSPKLAILSDKSGLFDKTYSPKKNVEWH